MSGGLALNFTADSLVTGEDVTVMTELATVGGVMGTIDSIRVATVRYDYRDQMVEYAADDGFGPHAYLYDALGRRVVRRVADGQTGQIVGTRFVSAGNTRSAASWQTIEEYDEATQMPTASYIDGNYIDEVLSMRRADGSGVVRDFYFHQDDLFNVTMVTDAAGAAVERYEYGDYGAPRFFDGGGAAISASALGAARLFNGREWDAEVAMYYYRTRYLEPSVGRFTARDTIGVWGDEHGFGSALQFVGANPFQRVDPFGRTATCPQPLGFFGFGCIWCSLNCHKSIKKATDCIDGCSKKVNECYDKATVYDAYKCEEIRRSCRLDCLAKIAKTAGDCGKCVGKCAG